MSQENTLLVENRQHLAANAFLWKSSGWSVAGLSLSVDRITKVAGRK